MKKTKVVSPSLIPAIKPKKTKLKRPSRPVEKKVAAKGASVVTQDEILTVHVSTDPSSFPATSELPTRRANSEINPRHDYTIDFRTSFTKDEAIGRLIVLALWNRPRKYIHLTWHGLVADKLPFLNSMPGSMEDQYAALRRAARLAASDAIEAGAAAEVIEEREEVVREIDELVYEIMSFRAEIDDEIAKKDASALRIDHSDTVRWGVTFFTFKSFEQWAYKTFGFPITELAHFNRPAGGSATGTERTERIYDDQFAALDAWTAKRAERSFCITHALVAEFLVAKDLPTRKLYRDPDGKPIASALAEVVAPLAAKLGLAGQSEESIRKNILYARKVLEDNLKVR